MLNNRFHKRIFRISVKDWLWEDEKYLKKLLKIKDIEKIKEKLSKENYILWKEKICQEDLLLDNLYNLEANEKAYLYEISIYRRIIILRSLNNIIKDTVPDINKISSYIKEMVQPITEKIVPGSIKTSEKYGSGQRESQAKPAGKMNCILVKEHDEMLYHWLYAKNLDLMKEKKILIHIDAHSDMSKIDEKDIKDMDNISDLKTLRSWFSSLYYIMENPPNLRTPISLANFIHYGVHKKLIREILWVMPDPMYCKYRLPANLKRYYILNIEEGKNFEFNSGHITCDWAGIKVHILRLSDLPEFNEDVILDIDMDYFISMDDSSDNHGGRGYRILNKKEMDYWNNISNVELEIGDPKPWITPEKFIDILKEKNIYSTLAFISLSPYFTHNYYHNMIYVITDLLGKGLNKL